jgi:hypothetical protein
MTALTTSLVILERDSAELRSACRETIGGEMACPSLGCCSYFSAIVNETKARQPGM